MVAHPYNPTLARRERMPAFSMTESTETFAQFRTQGEDRWLFSLFIPIRASLEIAG